MISTSEFRRGQKFLIDGQPHELVESEPFRPGKGRSVVRTRMRNLLTGKSIDITYSSGDKVQTADVEDREVQYLYSDTAGFHFMDPKSYEQYTVDKKVLADSTNFLLDNMEVNLVFFSGKPISITLPNCVIMEVTECAPAVRGNTATGASKKAIVSSGYECDVPLFVNQGDKIKIDTRTGEYLERA